MDNLNNSLITQLIKHTLSGRLQWKYITCNDEDDCEAFWYEIKIPVGMNQTDANVKQIPIRLHYLDGNLSEPFLEICGYQADVPSRELSTLEEAIERQERQRNAPPKDVLELVVETLTNLQ